LKITRITNAVVVSSSCGQRFNIKIELLIISQTTGMAFLLDYQLL
jgi:hypothetical protein